MKRALGVGGTAGILVVMGTISRRLLGLAVAAGMLGAGCRAGTAPADSARPPDVMHEEATRRFEAIAYVLRALESDRICIPPVILDSRNTRVQAMLADGTVLVSGSTKLDAAVDSELGRSLMLALIDTQGESASASRFVRESFDRQFLADVIDALVESSSHANARPMADVFRVWIASPRVWIQRDRAERTSVRATIPESSIRVMQTYLERLNATTRPATQPAGCD